MPLRSTANKVGEDVMESTQMCTIVGVSKFKCALSGFDTVGFQTTVTMCIAMFVMPNCDITSKVWVT